MYINIGPLANISTDVLEDKASTSHQLLNLVLGLNIKAKVTMMAHVSIENFCLKKNIWHDMGSTKPIIPLQKWP